MVANLSAYVERISKALIAAVVIKREHRRGLVMVHELAFPE